MINISDDRQELLEELERYIVQEAPSYVDSTTEDIPTKSPPRRAKSIFESIGSIDSDSSEDEKEAEIKRLKRELESMRSHRAGSTCKSSILLCCMLYVVNGML